MPKIKCATCKKKLNLVQITTGSCSHCGLSYCQMHRHPEAHACAPQTISLSLPNCTPSKIDRL